MPCALKLCLLEVNSMAGLKRKHLESPYSATTLYLHYHNIYGLQTWQGGDSPQGAPNHKITLLFEHVVLRDQVKK